MSRARLFAFLGLVVGAALIASGVDPYDRLVWLLEVAPVLVAAPILVLTFRRFPLTTLLYVLIALHALVLILGGTYSYARVPLGFWLQDLLDLSRNPYDRIGHFMQGFVPALVAREILLRFGLVVPGKMLGLLCVCVALAVSAVYEMVEWWGALVLGVSADIFLATQGDPWDTQSDMFMALIGATLAIVALSRLQDRQIATLVASDSVNR